MKNQVGLAVAACLFLVVGFSLGDSKSPVPRMQWEYGMLSTITIGSNDPLIHWNDPAGTISAKSLDDLIEKLKEPAAAKAATELDAMNALGDRGWEFIERTEHKGDFESTELRFKRIKSQ